MTTTRALPLAHAGQHRLQHVEGGVQVAVEHGSPAVWSEFSQRAFLQVGTGIGHQQVDLAQVTGRRRFDPRRVIRVGRVTGHGECPATVVECGQRSPQLLLVSAGDDDAGPLGQKQARGGQADAATAAGD